MKLWPKNIHMGGGVPPLGVDFLSLSADPWEVGTLSWKLVLAEVITVWDAGAGELSQPVNLLAQ